MLETSKDSESGVPAVRPTLVELFQTEESALLRFVYGIVKRRNIAEEIVQEGFLRLHKHWDEVEKPRPWIYRAVRNLALSHLRDNKREFETEEGVADSEDEKAGPDEATSQMEAIGTVRMLIEELDMRDRDLVRRKYIEEQSYKEIADAVGLTVGNVGYRLHHALKSLATSLRQAGIETSEG